MTGTDTTKSFADRLQDLIADSGKDVKTLASEIGVSSGALSKYQNDKGEPGITALFKIAQYFGVTTDYLVGLSDNRTYDSSNIGVKTGLSDKSIQFLSDAKASGYPLGIFNCLLEHKDLLDLINCYIFADTLTGTFTATAVSPNKEDGFQYEFKVPLVEIWGRAFLEQINSKLRSLREDVIKKAVSNAKKEGANNADDSETR